MSEPSYIFKSLKYPKLSGGKLPVLLLEDLLCKNSWLLTMCATQFAAGQVEHREVNAFFSPASELALN